MKESPVCGWGQIFSAREVWRTDLEPVMTLQEIKVSNPGPGEIKRWFFKGSLVKTMVLYRTMNIEGTLCMIEGSTD